MHLNYKVKKYLENKSEGGKIESSKYDRSEWKLKSEVVNEIEIVYVGWDQTLLL